jgi:hypothetical protein
MSDKPEKTVELQGGRKITTKEYLERLGEFQGVRDEDEERRLQIRIRNKENKRQGDALEDFLIRQANVEIGPDTLDLIYIPQRFKFWMPRTPQLIGALRRAYPRTAKMFRIFIARPLASTWVDFVGIWPGGDAHFDAKHTRSSAKSWRFGSQVETHQMTVLIRQHKKGKPSFIYLRHQPPPGLAYKDYVIPVVDKGIAVRNKTQVKWEKLSSWQVPKGKTWLDAAMAWDKYLEGGWSSLHKETQ